MDSQILAFLVLSWFFLGALGTNFVWIVRHLTRTMGPERSSDAYARGIIIGMLSGPLAFFSAIAMAVNIFFSDLLKHMEAKALLFYSV